MILFGLGAVFGVSLAMAALSVGQWQREGRSVVVFGRDLGRSQWSYALAFVSVTLVLPLGVVHDALRPRHPWMRWRRIT